MADTDTAPRSPGSSLDDFLTSRYGPLPGWAWLGIFAGGAGLYLWYRNSHGTGTATSTSAYPSGAAAAEQGFEYGMSYGTVQQEVSALQNGQATGTTGATTSTGTSTSTSGTAGSSTTQIAPWIMGQPESGQAWNADLNNIAAREGITLSALEQANPQIKNPNVIPPGTTINIPGH